MSFYDTSYFIPYAETKNNRGEWKVCMKLIQFRSWFRPSVTEISSFIIRRSFLAILVFLLMSLLMSFKFFLVVL